MDRGVGQTDAGLPHHDGLAACADGDFGRQCSKTSDAGAHMKAGPVGSGWETPVGRGYRTTPLPNTGWPRVLMPADFGRQCSKTLF